MLGKPLERLPAKVEPVEVGIGRLQPSHDPDRVRIVVEPAGLGQRRTECILAGMAKGWVTKIVREAQSLGQILVQAQRSSHGPPDLRHFKAVGQAHSIMVAVGRDEHLGLVAQAPERD